MNHIASPSRTTEETVSNDERTKLGGIHMIGKRLNPGLGITTFDESGAPATT